MNITLKEYEAAKKIVEEFEEEEDFDDRDWEEEEEQREFEEKAERASMCTCGAWVFNKNGEPVHIADCFCGAE